MKYPAEKIVEGIRQGDRLWASRLMSLVEGGQKEGDECLRMLGPAEKRAHVIGVTGWAGAGKSTLISRIARLFRESGKTVGIIAVDPTSPLSGGSILGDRERMKEIDGDEGVFIRSMATRGHTGGIARATHSFIRVMEALGKDVVILETVGVGQDQVAVSHLADTVVVVLMPGMGDYLQALKAGVLEVGDIYAVNKADRPGADDAVFNLTMTIHMSGRTEAWTPPVVKTVATELTGVPELVKEMERHWIYLQEGNLLASKRRAAVKLTLLEAIRAESFRVVSEKTGLHGRLDALADEILAGKKEYGSVTEAILRESGVSASD